MPSLFPSLLAADPSRLQELIKLLNPHCAGFHIDMMDGQFVPRSSWKPEEVNTLAALVSKKVWVHLMVENPLDTLATLEVPEGSIVSFHIETKQNKKHILDKVIEKNWLPSIAISPKTELKDVFPWVADLYQVLIMSVEPGMAGQMFLKDTISRIDPLHAYRKSAGLSFRIGIDGGIDPISIGLLQDKSVDDFVIGSSIFKSKDPIEACKILERLISFHES